jgi:hypothetical protein
MDATLYSGLNAPQTIVNQSQFQPDMVWFKTRNVVGNNTIYDVVRGVTKLVFPNSANAESTYSGGLTSFNTNGFSVAYSADSNFNASGYTYVAWQWQAGQGSTSSNTSGSITSTVSVNATAGFSIVTYTGNGTSGATVGHGLGVAPKFILIKRRQGSNNWAVAGSILGSASTLYLNLTNALETYTVALIGNIQTSTTFQVGNDGNRNESGGTFVAYCWAEIAGFSKFGSYVGNGSADGPFVYTGFRPKYVMIKNSSGASGGFWFIFDTSRSTSNVATHRVWANSSDAESSDGAWVDILSNGFKLRNTNSQVNESSQTLIYMAFAENPFKNANAR